MITYNGLVEKPAGREFCWIPAFARMTFLFLILFMSSARADDSPPPEPKVDPKLCKALPNYKEPAGVAYQPGVDVNGNKVAPANLQGSSVQMKLPEKINIPLTVSLTKYLNLNTSQLPAGALGSGTEAQLGTFTIEGNKVSFNGQPLTDEEQGKLADLCAKQKPAP